MSLSDDERKKHRRAERYAFLAKVHHWLEAPMVFIGTVWLVLLVIDLTGGLSPLQRTVFQAIWALFILDFLLEFVIAPDKLAYLRRNWLTALSLAIPALRVFPVLRATLLLKAAGTAKGARLIAVLGTINGNMRALTRSLGRRGIGYVLLLTVIVVLAGAAGMYSFEKGKIESMGDYGSAVWWTAMIMTTMGSGDWPVTTEGRILCFLLALYAFTIFGYITAALAGFFVGRDREEEPSVDRDRELREKLERLNRQLEELGRKLEREQEKKGKT